VGPKSGVVEFVELARGKGADELDGLAMHGPVIGPPLHVGMVKGDVPVGPTTSVVEFVEFVSGKGVGVEGELDAGVTGIQHGPVIDPLEQIDPEVKLLLGTAVGPVGVELNDRLAVVERGRGVTAQGPLISPPVQIDEVEVVFVTAGDDVEGLSTHGPDISPPVQGGVVVALMGSADSAVETGKGLRTQGPVISPPVQIGVVVVPLTGEADVGAGEPVPGRMPEPVGPAVGDVALERAYGADVEPGTEAPVPVGEGIPLPPTFGSVELAANGADEVELRELVELGWIANVVFDVGYDVPAVGPDPNVPLVVG